MTRIEPAGRRPNGYPDGAPVGGRTGVNSAPPVLGTFYTPVAARTDAAGYLVVMVKNWNWIAGTIFTSDRALP